MGIIGVASALVIIAFSFLVIRLYWPIGIGRWSKRHGLQGAEIYFAHGVVIGFISAATNALTWKIGSRTARYMLHENEMSWVLLEFGNLVDAFIIMPLLVWASYCYLHSAWLKLPEGVRHDWSWISRAFYPKEYSLVRHIENALRFVINPRR